MRVAVVQGRGFSGMPWTSLCCSKFELQCLFLFIHTVDFRLKMATSSPRSTAISISLENRVTIVDVQGLSHCPVPGVHWLLLASISLGEWEAELLNCSVCTALGWTVSGSTRLTPFFTVTLEGEVVVGIDNSLKKIGGEKWLHSFLE